MYNKKRVGILLVLSLFILLLAQSAFALFAEYLYFGGFDLFDPITSYYSSSGFRNVFHFLLFFFLISGIAKAFVGIHWGEDKVQKLSFLYIALGVLGGFSLSLLFFQNNWSVAGFGWLFFLLIIFLILITGYRLLVHGKEEGKKGMSIWIIVGLLVLTLFLIEFLFPQVSGYFRANELWAQLKAYALAALLILAVAGILKAVFEGSFGGAGHGGGEGRAPSIRSSAGEWLRRKFAPEPYEEYAARRGREREEGTRRGREETVREEEARREALRREEIEVVVTAEPERRFYTPRDIVRLNATVLYRRGGRGERHGRYRYRWIADGNPIGEGRTLNLQIGRMLHLGHDEEEKTIYVDVIDEEAEHEGIPIHGVGQIILRIVAGTPIIHAELNTGRVWETGFFTMPLGREIVLRYTREGPMPPDFHSINWYWIKGVSHDPINDDDFDRARSFSRDNNFTATIGEGDLRFMKEGETYTLMAIGVDRRGDAIILNDAEHVYGGRVVVKVERGMRGGREEAGARPEDVDAEYVSTTERGGPAERGFFGRAWDRMKGGTKRYVTTRDRERERRQKEALVRAARATASGVRTAAGAVAAGSVVAGRAIGKGAVAAEKYAREKGTKLGETTREKVYSSQEYNGLIVRAYNYNTQEIIQDNPNDGPVNVPLNTRVYFIPIISVGDITQYKVKWNLGAKSGDRFEEYTNEEIQAEGQPYYYLYFPSEGERILSCAFIKNGNLYKEIKLRLVTEEISTTPIERKEAKADIYVTLLSDSKQPLGNSNPKKPLIMNVKKGNLFYFYPGVIQIVGGKPRSVISDYQINVKTKNTKEGEAAYSEHNMYGYIRTNTEGRKIISLTFTTAGEVVGKCVIELNVLPKEEEEPNRPLLVPTKEVKKSTRWKFLEIITGKREKVPEPERPALVAAPEEPRKVPWYRRLLSGKEAEEEVEVEPPYTKEVERRSSKAELYLLLGDSQGNNLGYSSLDKPAKLEIEEGQTVYFYPSAVQAINEQSRDVIADYQILVQTNAPNEVLYSDETKEGTIIPARYGRKINIIATFTVAGVDVGKCGLEINVKQREPLGRPALVPAPAETRRNLTRIKLLGKMFSDKLKNLGKKTEKNKYALGIYSRDTNTYFASNNTQKIEAAIGQVYYLYPLVEDNKLEDYDINIQATKIDKDLFHFIKRENKAAIQLRTAGNKTVECVIRKQDKVVAKISVVLNTKPHIRFQMGKPQKTINRRNVNLLKPQIADEISHPEIFVQYQDLDGSTQKLTSSHKISNFTVKGMNNEAINFKVSSEKNSTTNFVATWKTKGGNVVSKDEFSCSYTPLFPGNNIINCGIYLKSKLVKGFIIKVEESEAYYPEGAEFKV